MYEGYTDSYAVKMNLTSPEKIQQILWQNPKNAELILRINNQIYNESRLQNNQSLQSYLEDMARNERIGFIAVESFRHEPAKKIYQLLVYEKQNERIRQYDQRVLSNIDFDQLDQLYELQKSIGLEFSISN